MLDGCAARALQQGWGTREAPWARGVGCNCYTPRFITCAAVVYVRARHHSNSEGGAVAFPTLLELGRVVPDRGASWSRAAAASSGPSPRAAGGAHLFTTRRPSSMLAQASTFAAGVRVASRAPVKRASVRTRLRWAAACGATVACSMALPHSAAQLQKRARRVADLRACRLCALAPPWLATRRTRRAPPRPPTSTAACRATSVRHRPASKRRDARGEYRIAGSATARISRTGPPTAALPRGAAAPGHVGVFQRVATSSGSLCAPERRYTPFSVVTISPVVPAYEAS